MGGISGITRSSMSDSPMGIYFSFFVLVMNAVVVLTVIVYPKSFLKNKKIQWKIAGAVFTILYLAGAVDGIRDAALTQQRIFWSRERLKFQPLLVSNDYRYLFPFKRFKGMLADLNVLNILDDVDTRPFAREQKVRFRKQITGREIYYIPDRALSPDEVIVFSGNVFSGSPATCYWSVAGEWRDEQSQLLQERFIDGRYWVIFRNRETPGFSEHITELKLVFSSDMDYNNVELPEPIVWRQLPST